MKNPIKAPTTVWDGVTLIWSALVVGGMLATTIYMLQVGIGQLSSWLLATTVFLIANCPGSHRSSRPIWYPLLEFAASSKVRMHAISTCPPLHEVKRPCKLGALT